MFEEGGDCGLVAGEAQDVVRHEGPRVHAAPHLYPPRQQGRPAEHEVNVKISSSEIVFSH